eukprot:7494762-Alexandrium_andersonii.AAC.1
MCSFRSFELADRGIGRADHAGHEVLDLRQVRVQLLGLFVVRAEGMLDAKARVQVELLLRPHAGPPCVLLDER